MRRMRLGIVGIVLLVGTACGTPAGDDGTLLMVKRAHDLVAVDVPGGGVRFKAPLGLVAPDGSRIVAAKHQGSETILRELDPAVGSERWRVHLPGRLMPRVVSRSGLVALTRVGRPGVVVVAGRGGELRRVELERPAEPEAFTSDEETLVIVGYLPERGPDRYRLLEFDLSSGDVAPLGARVKRLAPDEMQGSGRTAVWAPDASSLYTLFTLQPSGGHGSGVSDAAAFVHVLDLDGWAHCVDLPEGFGAGGRVALAIGPDGTALYAIDAAASRVAVVDTGALRVSRIVPIESFPDGQVVAAASAVTLAVGGGTALRLLDVHSLAERARLDLPDQPTGLSAVPGGFYALTAERIVAVNEHDSSLRPLDAILGATSIALVTP